jgi:hypothetical protein
VLTTAGDVFETSVPIVRARMHLSAPFLRLFRCCARAEAGTRRSEIARPPAPTRGKQRKLALVRDERAEMTLSRCQEFAP